MSDELRHVSDRDAAVILEDFEHARCHMLAHLRTKSAVHRDLPLILCGLARPCPMRARSAGRRAWALWMQMSDAERAHAHSHSRAVLADPDVLVEFQTFVNEFGRQLEDCPLLLMRIYRVALARIDEHEMDTSQMLVRETLDSHRANAKGP